MSDETAHDRSYLKAVVKISELEARLAIATEALEFYAHMGNWKYSETTFDENGKHFWKFSEKFENDYTEIEEKRHAYAGRRAREALAKIKREKE